MLFLVSEDWSWVTVSLMELCWSKWLTLWLKRPEKVFDNWFPGACSSENFPSHSQLSFSGSKLTKFQGILNWIQISCKCDFSGEREFFHQILQELMYPKGEESLVCPIYYLNPTWYTCSLFVFLISRVWTGFTQISLTVSAVCVSVLLLFFLSIHFSGWTTSFWVLF